MYVCMYVCMYGMYGKYVCMYACMYVCMHAFLPLYFFLFLIKRRNTCGSFQTPHISLPFHNEMDGVLETRSRSAPSNYYLEKKPLYCKV